jgi:hypothetical protein
MRYRAFLIVFAPTEKGAREWGRCGKVCPEKGMGNRRFPVQAVFLYS